MLRFVDSSPRSFFLKSLAINLFIAVFIAALLMLRSDVPSWADFFGVLSTSLVYTIACGSLTSSSFYLGERWRRGYNARSRIPVVLGFCLLSGLLGHLIGSTVSVLLQLSGHGGGPLSGAAVFQRVRARLVFMPVTAMITLFFGSLIYGYEMLIRRLEETIGRLKEKEVQAERLQKLKAEADLVALQARINPHFLFNTLNSIASLISENPRKAEDMTERLSALFRYTLTANRGDKVRLEQELYILRSYIDIEQLRLGSRLRVSIEVDGALKGQPVPPLLLQPLVENSIKYGVSAREDGGSIEVTGRRQGSRCVLEVVDDGPGFDQGPPKGAGLALDNIRQRLDMLYGGRHCFSIVRADGKTTVRVEIPMDPEGQPT